MADRLMVDEDRRGLFRIVWYLAGDGEMGAARTGDGSLPSRGGRVSSRMSDSGQSGFGHAPRRLHPRSAHLFARSLGRFVHDLAGSSQVRSKPATTPCPWDVEFDPEGNGNGYSFGLIVHCPKGTPLRVWVGEKEHAL